MKRVFVLAACAALVGAAVSLPAPSAVAQAKVLIFSVKEARAYAFKASLSKEVIEIIGQVNRCDPDEDPYQCDESKYNHKENCPKSLQIGEKGKAPAPKPPAETEPATGSAGGRAGPDEPPPQSSPVRINRFVSIAKLSDLGSGVLEAGGLASSLYVDLSGRAEPEGHTESEAFSNRVDYEERCYPEGEGGEVDEDAHEHFLSRSTEAPGTYHLAECTGRQCNFGAGFNAEKARSILHLYKKKQEVFGSLRAYVEGLTFQSDEVFTVDSLITYASFKSDGTPQGLRWQAVTTASGARIGGRPTALPPGDTVSGPGFSVGVAEPYVRSSKDGSQLTMVAPGLHFGSEQQSAFFGGAEVYASSDRIVPFEFDVGGGTDATTTGGAGGGGFALPGSGDASVGGFGTGETGAPGDGLSDPVAAEDSGELLIFEMPTGVGAVPAIIALGVVGWILLMSRWLQRFAWGRKLTRYQPLRAIDWVYRAFVKT